MRRPFRGADFFSGSSVSVSSARAGYRGVYVDHSQGRGLMPTDYAGLERQRIRWAFGGMQILRKHWRRPTFPSGSGALRALRRAPASVQIATAVAAAVALWAVANGFYQVIRKPTELFFPVSGTLYKSPSETWSEYQGIFRKHATDVISAELLAALAQVESSGNPIARTYWRWSWRLEPFELYRPASSAVGMYQITDGTLAEARRYCIHDHAVAEDGPWHSLRSCWFNAFYFRVVPSHAVELTSAYLDRGVASLLARHRIRRATLAQKRSLAALIHLCGFGAGDEWARRGLRFSPRLRCGDHPAPRYLARVDAMQRVFAALAAESQQRRG